MFIYTFPHNEFLLTVFHFPFAPPSQPTETTLYNSKLHFWWASLPFLWDSLAIPPASIKLCLLPQNCSGDLLSWSLRKGAVIKGVGWLGGDYLGMNEEGHNCIRPPEVIDLFYLSLEQGDFPCFIFWMKTTEMVSSRQQVLSISNVPGTDLFESTPSSVKRSLITHCVLLEGHPTSEFVDKYFKDFCSLQKWWQGSLYFSLIYRNKFPTNPVSSQPNIAEPKRFPWDASFLRLQSLVLTMLREQPEMSTKGPGEAQRCHEEIYAVPCPWTQ